MIAHTYATNARNKRSFSAEKVDDTITKRRKMQRDMGRYEAMKYFDEEKMNTLTWSVLVFDDGKLDSLKLDS